MKDNAAEKDLFEELLEGLRGSLKSGRKSDIYKEVVEATEKTLIDKALRRTFGNQLKAAKILGINRNTLRAKINKFGITPERWKI